MSDRDLIRGLKGRRIIDVRLNKFRTGQRQHPWTCDPELLFGDGSRLRFVVIETEVGEYGVELVHLPAPGADDEEVK